MSFHRARASRHDRWRTTRSAGTIRAMSTIAVGLVLLSAVFHATWNTLTKRSADAVAFMFVFGIVALAVYAIPRAAMLDRHGLPA
ncbi:MAG TPA: hypothetical protein PKA95_10085, partial [Thermomicrobiales bacterium]|nr:hypothetical protein [Thermomicrobiales bacterium]